MNLIIGFILGYLIFISILIFKNKIKMSQFTDAQKAIYASIRASLSKISADTSSLLTKQTEYQAKLEEALRNGVSQEDADALIAEGQSILADMKSLDETVPDVEVPKEEGDSTDEEVQP